MALIKCPECGKEVSDKAGSCPECGCPISRECFPENARKQNKNKIVAAPFGVVLLAFVVSVFLPNTKKNRDYESYSYSYSGGSSSSYGTSRTPKNDDSTIFRHLEITNFSCRSGKYYGKMQCSVKNNNSHTVGGWFRVNFYDSGGTLIYNQLMSLPDVAPGESVVCSTTIPRDDYPHNYADVTFSQATLSIED